MTYMDITYYGHSCVGIKIGEKHLLVDPFISENPLASHIKVDEIPADYILLTCAQQDHTSDVERIAKRTKATIIANYQIVAYFYNKGIENGHPMDLGGSYTFPFGQVKCVTALHSSAFEDGTDGGSAGGFVIKAADKTIYIAGSTALHFDMQLIPVRFKIDMALLPIGGNFTMDVEDAIMASDFVKCNKVLGLHYDTFTLIKIDKSAAQRSFKAKGKELILLNIGQTTTV